MQKSQTVVNHLFLAYVSASLLSSCRACFRIWIETNQYFNHYRISKEKKGLHRKIRYNKNRRKAKSKKKEGEKLVSLTIAANLQNNKISNY